MDVQDNCFKCFPIIPRQGKKKFFFLLTFNLIIIWLIYRYSQTSVVHNTKSATYAPLYDVPIFHIPLLSSKDMIPYYTDISSNTWCLTQGTDIRKSKKLGKCKCFQNWFGLDCGIPSSVWKSKFLQEGKNAGVEIRRREKPRRIILSIIFEDAFELLDISIRDSFSVVDVFLIAEDKSSSESAFNMFKNGYLSEFQRKIMPIQLKESAFSKNDHERISSMLSDLWVIGWNRLSDFRPDDIFVFSHVSSIVSKDILLFLKLYDGYPEPFYFYLRPSLFKFSKVLQSSSIRYTIMPFKPLGCTFQFLSTMCGNSVMKFLGTKCLANKSHQLSFEKTYWPVKEWELGNEKFPSGWQCNFCCNTECILNSIRKQKWSSEMYTSMTINPLNITASVIDQFIKLKYFKNHTIIYKTVSNSDLYFAPKVVVDSKEYSYLIF